MPTGYTAAIAEGISFEEFALTCARNFGACIMQRDDPMSPKLVLDKVSDYHVKALEKANADLAKLRAMTEADIKRACNAAFDKACADAAKSRKENAELQSKYEAMLAKVRAWTPPSKDHVGMKEFMIDQIMESIRFDCGCKYLDERVSELNKLTPAEWHEKQIGEALRSIEYHEKHHAEEVQRTNDRNEWKRQLVKSLGGDMEGAK